RLRHRGRTVRRVTAGTGKRHLTRHSPPATEGHPMFEEADLIHRYSRADALRDGVLIDVSATAREAGIRWPVALTRAVRERCVGGPPGVACQDEAGRLWDVAWMLACPIRRDAAPPP